MTSFRNQKCQELLLIFSLAINIIGKMHSDDEDYMPKVVDIRGTSPGRLNRQRTIEREGLQKALNVLTESNQQPIQPESAIVPKEESMNEKGQAKLTATEISKTLEKARQLNRGSNIKQQLRKQRQEQISKSKQLILQMQNKINSNKFSEQSYPITQETIQKLIDKIDIEIEELQAEADSKRDAEKSQFVKRELEGIQTAIRRCNTIKELYIEKISLKEKISILEKNNIRLKEENTNLKFKIDIGIQKISDHMHNLPCEKQKQLKEQVNKLDRELRREKEMRIGLENSISKIVLNFKTLYDEADTARLIIVHKITELQEKEKLINEAMKPRVERRSVELQTSLKSKKSMSITYTDEKGSKKEPAASESTNKPAPPPLTTGFGRTTGQQPTTDKVERTKERSKPSVSMFSMEEHLQKMRQNQSNLTRRAAR